MVSSGLMNFGSMFCDAHTTACATDWPFENIDHAADWFDVCSISEADRHKIGRTNSARLFKLGVE